MNFNFFEFIKEKHDIDFNDKQKEAITSIHGPVLVLACPGSGKTTVLNARIAYLTAICKVSPRSILALTFSRAAAIDMNDRFNKIYGELLGEEVRFSTIHSFAYRIIRRFYHSKNINYELIEGLNGSLNKKTLLKKIYKNIYRGNINDDKLEDLVNAISYVKNFMIDPEEFESYNIKIRGFKKIYLAYEEYKKNNELNKILLDFDDMLIEALNILKNNPMILKKLQNIYKYILVDEGQDTSLVQNMIIELLVKPQNNLFIVCDDDQSIYGFRGADPSYLLNFEERFKDAKIIYMEKNYRSTKNIVDISNKFIKNNKNRYPKNMYTENTGKSPVKIVRLNSEKDQINYIIEAIKKTKKLSEIAILYRNNISSILLAQRLSEEGIDYYMKDYYKHFFNHWVLKDILNFVRFSFDTSNVQLLESIYTKFNSYISKRELEYLYEGPQTKSVFLRLIDMPGIPEIKRRGLNRFENDFKYLKTLGPLKTIKFIKEDLGYSKRIEGYCDIVGLSIDNAKNVLIILEELSKDTNTMHEFVDKINDLKRIMHHSKKNKYNDSVTLSTLHSAKGLEFDKVYMIDLVDGEIPTKDSIKFSELGHRDYMEEDRRLWYVGMTRAKEHLELITIDRKSGEIAFPSRFIKELQEHIPESQEHVKDLGFKPYSIVRHTKFGLGMVKDITPKTIKIDFDDRGMKELAIDLCIERNLLKTVKFND